MKKLLIAPAALFICLSGCTSYTVHVNGFSEVEKPLWEGAAIYVAKNEDSDNQIFDTEVKRKIEQMLRKKGYVPSAREDVADFKLAFELGVDARKITGAGARYVPAKAGIGSHPRYYYGGYYGTYAPYVDTVYDVWLMMRIYDTGRTEAARKDLLVWVGEAVSPKYSVNIREAVDYLLVGTFEYFGENTKKRMVLELDENDERIKRIAEY